MDGIMQLNDFGEIAKNQLEWLEKQYPYIELHNYIVMPNHIHILMEINRVVRTGRDLSLHLFGIRSYFLGQARSDAICPCVRL